MALPEPITRLEKYWAAILDKIQGGGSSVTVEPLTVTQNGTQTAPSGKAYSPVTTNVPNSYGAADEGKVVNNGALVAQTAHAPVTANGTIDTTLYNSVPVNVDGNPNYVETIEGTLFSPFGNYTRDGLLSGIDAGEITAILTVSLDGKEYIMPGQRHAKVLSFSRLVRLDIGTGSPSYLAAVSVTYQSSGFNTPSSSYYSSGSWIIIKEEDAKEIPCTLTIIHHPLPDSE